MIPEPMLTAKYFIAIVLPEPILGKVEKIKQELFKRHGIKGALRCPAHITLHRPFEWKENKEVQLIDSLKRFNTGEAIDVQLHNFGFFEPRVVYVDVSTNKSLIHLHDNLVKFAKRELNLFNEAEDLRGFHPHVTIAFRDLKKPLFYSLREKFEKEIINENFQCNAFSLLKLHEKWEILHNFHI